MLRLIIDTDTAGDDTISLLMALKWPGVRLEAVTVVCGNVEFSQQVENALYTVENFADHYVPVYPGCDRPFLRTWKYADYVHGKDGMGENYFPKARQRPENKHAVQALLELVNSSPGEYTIIAQGPLTNIATAIMLDKNFVKKVRRLYIMGGYADGYGNVTPAAEYNFWVDPDAAKIVLHSGINPFIVGWDIAVKYSVVEEDMHREIAKWGTREADFFVKVNRKVVEFEKRVMGIPGSTHPDTITTAIAIEPKIARKVERRYVDVENQSELTRGMSVVDHRGVLGKEPNADVCYEADAQLFREMLFKILRGR
ncbi:MAG: nucleoside hydrolase [Candidatus Caldarchaeum sp.]|uniref:Inosine/uridine-preferring nucleoside hydrolase domain-containing protein n=1 Tax=Caldiarchaeum subterraneum TaxID=311458 RepID=A0A7C4I809_CALS0|nr:nucleoside hydrolase [Candidatus Caldarchaeales archaeon]MDJ0272399.1 nucleoside hydrolase [Candidatus Caldarchaeales archaeon]